MKHFFAISYNILSLSLRPWLKENRDDEKFSLLNAKIRNHKNDHQTFFKELGKAYKSMNIEIEAEVLTEFKELSAIQTNPDFTKLHVTIDQPSFFDKKTEFYSNLLKNEYFAVMHGIYEQIRNLDDDGAKYKLYNLFEKIKELINLIPRVTDTHKTTIFVLQSLNLHLFNIHTELKRLFPNLIEFDVLSQNEMIYLITPDFEIEKTSEQTISFFINNYLQKDKPTLKGTGEHLDQKLSFNFNQSSTQILEDIYTPLTLKIDFINEELTSMDDFITVMTAKNLKGLDKKIHIGCETTQFRYIVDKMKPFFKNLTLANIEKSELFFSKNGVVIKASNLSRNKNLYPKEKENIDNVFKKLQ